jgi:hypothetical protein
MKSLFYLLLILIKYSYSHIKVLIDHQNGNYNITIKDKLWLRSSYTGLYLNNQWFKSNNNSLDLIHIDLNQGNHSILGEWNQTQFIYQFYYKNQFENLSTIIREWKSLSIITFYFNNLDFEIENDFLLDMDRVSTVFPSFFMEKFDENDQRGYFTYGGKYLF